MQLLWQNRTLAQIIIADLTLYLYLTIIDKSDSMNSEALENMLRQI